MFKTKAGRFKSLNEFNDEFKIKIFKIKIIIELQIMMNLISLLESEIKHD